MVNIIYYHANTNKDKMRYNSHISKNDNIKNIGYDLYWQECGEKELSSTLGRRIVYSNPYEYLAFPEK